MKQKSTFMGLIAILSLTMALAPTLIDDASALKSAGNPLLKYGSATGDIVCGGVLCSEVNTITVAEKTIKIEGLEVFYLEENLLMHQQYYCYTDFRHLHTCLEILSQG